MPKEGFTQVTIADHLKERLRRAAEAEGLSMPKLISKMLGDQYPDTPIPKGMEEKEK